MTKAKKNKKQKQAGILRRFLRFGDVEFHIIIENQ